MLLIFQSYQLVRNLRKGISVESQPEHQRVITQETDSLDMYYSTNPITNNTKKPVKLRAFLILKRSSQKNFSKNTYILLSNYHFTREDCNFVSVFFLIIKTLFENLNNFSL